LFFSVFSDFLYFSFFFTPIRRTAQTRTNF